MVPASEVVIITLFAAMGSAACCTLIVITHCWHGKFSLDHDLEGVQKFHHTPVPRIGGLALVLGMFWALLVSSSYTDHFPAPHKITFSYLLMLAAMPVFVAGFIEDLTKKVRVSMRLSAAFASAFAASYLLGATVDALDIWGLDTLLTYAPFALLVTAFVVAGGINAINIIDGLHGFAASAVLVMLAALGYLGWQQNDLLVVHLAMMGFGAVAGFMLLNYPTGKIFLGDGGAYLLGFWVSEIAVLLLVRNPQISAWQVLAICAYPIIEVLYSIYRRKIIRKRCAAQPDCLHLHTLLYRRIACKKLPYLASKPWLRNASVASFVVMWTSIMALLAITMGNILFNAAMLVLLQVLLYMAVYTRLVRGHWCINPAAALGLVSESRRAARITS